ncbi:hypothetical protein E5S69_32045 [Cupriavidus necator]|uniref:hypothetical protein n=1 Tax=Cupriavidus necator TaxID=106590 RepID=UPI00148F9BD3|nr:hypothetical protein [Cupriavidus necator]NOV28120.1 hypothetical protein [Cupriavidus necator]
MPDRARSANQEQRNACPGDLWSAVAGLSGEQLHTIIDPAQRSPKPATDQASFRARVVEVFGNVAGFESTPPSESMLRELWEKYRSTRSPFSQGRISPA